jgi:hypothetical protein
MREDAAGAGNADAITEPQVSRARRRATVTGRGEPAAVLTGGLELADLEDALAVARYRARHLAGEKTPTVPHADVRRLLGLDG